MHSARMASGATLGPLMQSNACDGVRKRTRGGRAFNSGGGGVHRASWLDPPPPPSQERAQLTAPQNPTETDPWAPEVTGTEHFAKSERGNLIISGSRGFRKVIIWWRHTSYGDGDVASPRARTASAPRQRSVAEHRCTTTRCTHPNSALNPKTEVASTPPVVLGLLYPAPPFV